MSEQETFETELNRSTIISQDVSVKSGQEGSIKEATEIRQIRAKDGRTMYQAWDVTVDTMRNQIKSRENYRQLKGRQGYAGAYNSGQTIETITNGKVKNNNLADSTKTRTIVRGGGKEFILKDYSQTQNVMRLAANDNVPGDQVVAIDANGNEVVLSVLREMLESPNKVIAYTTQ